MSTTPDPLSDKAQLAAHRAREMTLAKRAGRRGATEAWLETLGSKFVDIRLYLPGPPGPGRTWAWETERHIDDPETLAVTVGMSLDRLGARFAVWRCPVPDERWVLYDRRKGTTRCYPNQEAAEMVVICRGC